jgi:hypothetical protein
LPVSRRPRRPGFAAFPISHLDPRDRLRSIVGHRRLGARFEASDPRGPALALDA